MFEFDWAVDQDGYDWADDASRGWVLRRRGGPNRFYRPLEDNPGLFRRFASLPAIPDRDAILEFTNRFGFIDGNLDSDFFLFDQFKQQQINLSYVVSILETEDQKKASVAFNSLLHPRFRIWMDIRPEPPEMQIVPVTLYAAMMVQLAQEIAGIVRFRKCKHCPEWFSLGKNQATTRREFCSDRCRVAWHRQNRTETQP